MKLAVNCFTKKVSFICRRRAHFKAQGVDVEACVPERFLEQDWKGMGRSNREARRGRGGGVFGEKCDDLYRCCGIAVRRRLRGSGIVSAHLWRSMKRPDL